MHFLLEALPSLSQVSSHLICCLACPVHAPIQASVILHWFFFLLLPYMHSCKARITLCSPWAPQLALSSTEQLYHVHLVSHYLSVAQSHLFLARAPYKGEELIQMALDLPLCQGEVGISKAHILRVPPITERRHVAGTWGCLVTSGSIRKQRPDKGRAQVGNWTPSKPCTTDATVQRFNNFPKQCQQRGPKRSDTRTSRGRLTCQLLASWLNHSHHCLNYGPLDSRLLNTSLIPAARCAV